MIFFLSFMRFSHIAPYPAIDAIKHALHRAIPVRAHAQSECKQRRQKPACHVDNIMLLGELRRGADQQCINQNRCLDRKLHLTAPINPKPAHQAYQTVDRREKIIWQIHLINQRKQPITEAADRKLRPHIGRRQHDEKKSHR